jgi:hypothetical protein
VILAFWGAVKYLGRNRASAFSYVDCQRYDWKTLGDPSSFLIKVNEMFSGLPAGDMVFAAAPVRPKYRP